LKTWALYILLRNASLSRRCNEDTSDGTSERLRRALDGEKAQMEAYNALADEAAAEAKKAELKKEQELDQVQALFCLLEWHTIHAHACCEHAPYRCHAAGILHTQPRA